MNEYIKQISERIRELRDILDMDADDVARAIGVTKDEYFAYETGAKRFRSASFTKSQSCSR